MMKNIRSTLLFSALVVGLATCTRFDTLQPDASGNEVFNPDGTLAATICVEVPGMTATMTRALDGAPSYDVLDLYALVFEEGEGLKQYARLERKDALVSDNEHGHTELLEFTISLEPTEKTATLHLIATNQPRFEEQIVFGTEERVVTALYTDNGFEAYWQRLPFESNIPSKEQTDPANADNNDPFKRYDPEAVQKAVKIEAQLKHVPLVRNFCRVSVDATGAAEKDGFTLTGLYVVNTVDRGSVAPYVTTAEHRTFVDGYCTVGPDGKYHGSSYADISAKGHIGSLPAGVQLLNKVGGDIETKSENPTGGNIAPVYFYERPARVNSTERTYVLLRGHRRNEKDTYYKVDLGHIDENFKDEGNDDAVVGRFEYYNLLRNFDFKINLQSVTEQGYASLEEAAKGAVFNNFSASVEARTMTSISDGEDMIFVKFYDPVEQEDIFFTSYVFTQPGEVIHLKSQFRTGIADAQGGEVHNELIRVKFDPDEGDAGVIAGIMTVREDSDADADAKDEWNEYEVTGGEPTDMLRQQTVYVYRGAKTTSGGIPEYGLYRMVTFFSHTPWPFVHMDTFPGLWNDFDEAPWNWSEEWREIGQSAGSPLTLFFELPAGLPQAIFPLEFVIESDRQNIQNAYAGNAVVRSVPADESLFYTPGASGNPTSSRIQYVKTVTWADYYGEYNEEQIGTGSSIVRCRFLTITDLNQDGIGVPDGKEDSQSQTRLRVANPYFGVLQDDGKWQMYHEDGFERTTRTSDPSPRSWNFSSSQWSSVLTELTGDRSKQIKTTVDNLMLYEANEGPNYSMSGGTYTVTTDDSDPDNPVTETYYYIQTSKTGTSLSSGDRFRYDHDYPAEKPREIRLAVMATDAEGRADKDNLIKIITENTGGSVTLQNGYPQMDDSTKPFPTVIYQYDVAPTTSQVRLAIMPKNNVATRFYKIDFFPRWDEVPTNE